MRLVSLTQELKNADSPITAFFKERFPNVDPVAGAFDAQFALAQTLSPPVARNPFPYATIGTAIDYRLCYYFWTTPYRALPAFKCARTFDSRYPALGDTADQVTIPWNASDPTSGVFLVTRLVRDFFESLERTLDKICPVKRRLNPVDEACLCRYCSVLALIEDRAHPTTQPTASLLNALPRTATLEDLLALVPSEWIDLQAVYMARGYAPNRRTNA